jgi:hypothetical protein
VGTNDHSPSVDQCPPGLVGPRIGIDRSGSVARTDSNPTSLLLGTLLIFLFDFWNRITICCAWVVQAAPYMRTRRVERSGSARWNSQDPGNGSKVAGIGATFEFYFLHPVRSPDLVG